MTVIHLFRRDLRLEDNTALNKALATGENVIPVFIFDDRQQEGRNEYFSKNAFQFLVESLIELDEQLQQKGSFLHVYQGKPQELLPALVKEHDITTVYANQDYTPFSKQRDEELAEVIPLTLVEDALLHPINATTKPDGEPYSVYTPFWKKASQQEVRAPKTTKGSFCTIPRAQSITSIEYEVNEDLATTPGRSAAKEILKEISHFKNYANERDFPAQNATTHLSAHLKFGTISPREIYVAVAKDLNEEHPLIRQLYWREFYYHIAHHFPHVFGNAFHDYFSHVQWDSDKEKFRKWCEGKTGFPIVDAGMRELVTTGYMHNRVRMIVASFLTKDLHLDWRWGEKFFAQHLVDYDPILNNGNWQWSASTGADGAPYFRIFNPWRQQERFDPDCAYIKKWVPELAALSAKTIHGMENNRPLQLISSTYPAPLLHHQDEAEDAKARYKLAKESHH